MEISSSSAIIWLCETTLRLCIAAFLEDLTCLNLNSLLKMLSHWPVSMVLQVFQKRWESICFFCKCKWKIKLVFVEHEVQGMSYSPGLSLLRSWASFRMKAREPREAVHIADSSAAQHSLALEITVYCKITFYFLVDDRAILMTRGHRAPFHTGLMFLKFCTDFNFWSTKLSSYSLTGML